MDWDRESEPGMSPGLFGNIMLLPYPFLGFILMSTYIAFVLKLFNSLILQNVWPGINVFVQKLFYIPFLMLLFLVPSDSLFSIDPSFFTLIFLFFAVLKIRSSCVTSISLSNNARIQCR